jgi:mannose-6-phosphate isomerase-like protein (cupin superfamily)
VISLSSPEIVQKVWGHEVIIHNDERYCGKILVIKAGHRISLQYHLLKTETWYIHSGKGMLRTVDTAAGLESEQPVERGLVVEIPRGSIHQIEALEDLELIEVSTQHFDDDTYRIRK